MARLERGVCGQLADLGEFRNGVNFGKNMKGSGLGLINVKDIFHDSPKVDFESLDMVNLATSRGIERYFVEEGDLFFVRSSVKRDGIGFVAYSDKTNHYAVHCGFVIRFRPDKNKVNSRFLTYALRSPDSRERIRNLSSGAAITNISQEALRTLSLDIPALPVQRRIASILSAYDDLIENNQGRIHLLETMARALYREWFVHFRFPGHRNPRRITSSLGDIPLGWKVVTLKDVTTKIGSGATPRGGKEAYKTAGTSLIRSLNIYDYQFEFSNLAFINDEQAAQLDNVAVEPRDVLLNITGASVARCSMVPSHILPARVNQHVAIVRADSRYMDPYYLLDAVNNEQNKQKLLGLAQGGATREALTKDTISNFLILLPPRELVLRYGKIAGPLHAQRETLNHQTQYLRCTRDLLLPRLFSGQVKLETN